MCGTDKVGRAHPKFEALVKPIKVDLKVKLFQGVNLCVLRALPKMML